MSNINKKHSEIVKKDSQILDQHLNPVQKLRMKMQIGNYTSIEMDQLMKCSEFDHLSTCQELLAFQQYDLFDKLRKKKPISDVELVECSGTRQLYRGYIQAKKGMTSKPTNKYKQQAKKQLNIKDLQEQKKKQKRNKIIKFAIILIILILCSGVVYKYRGYLLNLIKMILNIK